MAKAKQAAKIPDDFNLSEDFVSATEPPIANWWRGLPKEQLTALSEFNRLRETTTLYLTENGTVEVEYANKSAGVITSVFIDAGGKQFLKRKPEFGANIPDSILDAKEFFGDFSAGDGDLPLHLLEQKQKLEADGWQFDFDGEKREWSGVKAGEVGGTGFHSLEKLLGFIEKHLNGKVETTETDFNSNHFISPEVAELIKTSRFAPAFDGMNRFEIVKALGDKKKKKAIGVTEETVKLYEKTGYALAAFELAHELEEIDPEFLFNQVGSFVLKDGLIEQTVRFHYCANWSYGFSTQTHIEFWTEDGEPMPLSETGYRSDFPDDPIFLEASSLADYIEKRVLSIVEGQAKGKKEKEAAAQIEILDVVFARTEIRSGHEYRELEAKRTAAAAEEETEAEADSPKPERMPTTVVISCRVELTDSEILEKAYSLRHAQQQLTDEISRFEREKDIHKSNVKAINSRIETFGHAIDSKSEYRDLECSLEYDFERETVVTIRPDTGEIVKRRGMTADELQRRLF